jgi:nucleoside-diphosphate-sugar epimerase
VTEFVRPVRRVLRSGLIQIGPDRVAELGVQEPFDGAAARRDFGYEPEWTLERGLADYAEWLKTHEL